MQLKPYLETLYDYNFWANHRYFTVAEGLTDEQLHLEQGHSWGNVQAVFIHMLSSEWVWLQRWHGVSPKGHFDPGELPTLASVKERWSKQETELRAYLGSQTEESLQTVITYTNFRGETFHVPLWQMLSAPGEPRDAPSRRTGGDVRIDGRASSGRRADPILLERQRPEEILTMKDTKYAREKKKIRVNPSNPQYTCTWRKCRCPRSIFAS